MPIPGEYKPFDGPSPYALAAFNVRAAGMSDPLRTRLELRREEWVGDWRRCRGREKGCSVYFIEAEGCALIKIGHAFHVQSRFATLQTMSPVALSLMLTVRGSTETEAALHFIFRDLRHHGEWFRAAPELREYISVTAGAVR